MTDTMTDEELKINKMVSDLYSLAQDYLGGRVNEEEYTRLFNAQAFELKQAANTEHLRLFANASMGHALKLLGNTLGDTIK